jgi:hypothetical protein
LRCGHFKLRHYPGAGKTTSLQKICADHFSKRRTILNYNFPVLVRLRELSSAEPTKPLLRHLRSILHLTFEFDSESHIEIHKQVQHELADLALFDYLESMHVLLLLDGFDEIASTEVRAAVLADIRALTDRLKQCKVLITSRSSEFKFKIPRVQKLEIAPLTKNQIVEFAKNWLGPYVETEIFLSKLFSSPFADTAIRPLTIAHLCAIYERLKNIPEKPKSVYRKIVNLLLEEWDAQRDVRRMSAYASFDQDRKLEFLAHLAYLLTINRLFTFDRRALRRFYDEICAQYTLPSVESYKVVAEIESHTGLLYESGYEQFEFAHKSIQEFLTADYIVRLPSIATGLPNITQLQNELALAISLSSRPGSYLAEVILKLCLSSCVNDEWYIIFLARLKLERVDFGGFQSPDFALAALILASKTNTTDSLEAYFAEPISALALREAFKIYQPSPTTSGPLKFQLTNREAHVGFPFEIVIPRGTFGLTGATLA